MNKGDIIHGYKILEDFRVIGGMSKVSFAERGGKEYFIKEFLSPKYPVAGSPGSERVKAQKRKACDEFEAHHNEINRLIGTKVSLGGNLVYAVDFFRDGATYFKINEKVDTSSLSLSDISSLPIDKIIIIARSVCHSVGILHDLNIVHGDLKPDNILIKEASRNTFSGKLIDFDDSYFSQRPPADRTTVVGTPEYYSPELAAYIKDEDKVIDGSTLTLASDIFALGVIFAEYFTGEKPVSGAELHTWDAVTKGHKPALVRSVDPEIEHLILAMLAVNPDDRPTVKKVNQKLSEIKNGRGKKSPLYAPRPKPAPSTESSTLRINFPKRTVTSSESTSSSGTLRGKMLKK